MSVVDSGHLQKCETVLYQLSSRGKSQQRLSQSMVALTFMLCFGMTKSGAVAVLSDATSIHSCSIAV